MAAIEKISRLYIRPHDTEALIDIRSVTISREKALDDTDNSYDPRSFRKPRQPIRPWMAYFNLIRSMLGVGLLGMPAVVSQCGILAGPLIIIGAGLLLMHTQLLLLSCLNEICRQLKIPQISYRYGFRIALLHGPPFLEILGHHGPGIISTFMLLTQFGLCAATVSMTAVSLQDILDWDSPKSTLAVLFIPYMCLQFLMKNFKHVSYVSLASTGINFVGLSLVVFFIFNDPHGDMTLKISHLSNFLFVFGIILFNLSAVGVILEIDKSLVDPSIMVSRFGVICVGIAIPTVIGSVLGILGYWAFGYLDDNVLRFLPFDSDAAMVCIGLYLVTLGLTFPLQCYPATSVIVEIIKYNPKATTKPSEETLEFIEVLARLILVVATFIFCFIAPFQAPIVAFVGNLCTTLLALVFPALMDISLRYPHSYGSFKFILYKDLAIVFLGIVSWIFGAIYCAYLVYIRVLTSRSINSHEYF